MNSLLSTYSYLFLNQDSNESPNEGRLPDAKQGQSNRNWLLWPISPSSRVVISNAKDLVVQKTSDQIRSVFWNIPLIKPVIKLVKLRATLV